MPIELPKRFDVVRPGGGLDTTRLIAGHRNSQAVDDNAGQSVRDPGPATRSPTRIRPGNDVRPDTEGDVVVAAQPGQRMQNSRIGRA